MQIALELVGWDEIPLDSGIHIPGKDIKRLIFTMDANVGLLHMAARLGFDAVVCHHPCGVLLNRGEVYRRHIDLLVENGIDRDTVIASVGEAVDTAARRMTNARFRMLYHESPNQTVLEVDAARLLDLPFMNIHNPFDEQGRRILQATIDETAERNPKWKAADVLDLIKGLPEAVYAKDVYGISPEIFVGDPDSDASKAVFIHGALSAPDAGIINFYWESGFKTIVALHTEFGNLESLRKESRGNLILTGHFLGDSLGMTPFIRALRDTGVEVVCMGGIIDVAK
jgi:putative NIF3 family GTP cyclohydrolase 1 type 2